MFRFSKMKHLFASLLPLHRCAFTYNLETRVLASRSLTPQQVLLVYAVTQFGKISLATSSFSLELTWCQRASSLRQRLRLPNPPPRYPDSSPVTNRSIHSFFHLSKHILLGRWEFRCLFISICQQTLVDMSLLAIQRIQICLTLFGVTSPSGIGASRER
jgi:hypothetical protein